MRLLFSQWPLPRSSSTMIPDPVNDQSQRKRFDEEITVYDEVATRFKDRDRTGSAPASR